jgi:hypothetical protein
MSPGTTISSTTDAIPITALSAIEECLPDLIRGVKATTSEAWHTDFFRGRLGSWASFEKIVRTTRLTMHLDDTIIGYKMPVLPGQPWNLHGEQLTCGDEASVQARFQAQVHRTRNDCCQFSSR